MTRPALSEPPQRKRGTTPAIFPAVAVAVVAAVGGGTLPAAHATGNEEPMIRYEVSGVPGTAEYLSYEIEFSQGHEANVPLPWSKQFKDTPPGHTLLISAQGHGAGSITCRILVDGKLVSQATASGDPARTVCSPSR